MKVAKMINTRKKLIIWDFDGVIADTECLWMQNRQKLLNERFNLGWDLEKTNLTIGGMNWRTRIATLQNLGLKIDNSFEDEVTLLDYESLAKGISLTPGVEKIFAHQDIKQCIATGGDRAKTERKLKAVGIENIFPENRVFCSDMVKQGKPAPDLFLLAAEKMGEKPENCVVIEDSIAGLTAAQNAKMETIAFVGSKMNNNPNYIAQVKKSGIEHIFDNMIDVEKFLFE